MRNVSTRELLIICGLAAGLIGIVLLVLLAQGPALTVAGVAFLAGGWAMLGIFAVIGSSRPVSELRQVGPTQGP